MKRALIALALLSACGGKKAASGSGSGSAAGTAVATGSGTGTGTGTAGGSPAEGNPLCETPCRLLADTALADIADTFEKTCGLPYHAPAATDCDALDYQRNCIYAVHGYTFKKARWRDAFGKQPWYKARADFKESDLSKVAITNVRDLKEQAATCRGETASAIPATFTASSITKADLATLVAWFSQKSAGDPPLPAKLESDGQPATADEIRRWFASPHLFTLESWTPIRYDDDSRGKGPRRITASTGDPGPDCTSGDEDCEGFEWITFELDAAGKIVGISVGAAACPLVYVDDTYEGEILRNLVHPEREATQHLRLDAARTCSATREVHVNLVEAKDELTFLDDVALVVDGVAIPPRDCAGAYCANDGLYHTLAHGQTLSLTFDIPTGASCDKPVLRADGFYVPILPTLAR